MQCESPEGYVTSVRTTDQIKAIEALRKEAYERAPEFRIQSELAHTWTPADSRGHVLAVWNRSGEALATGRMLVMESRAEAEDQLQCTVPHEPQWFPGLLLGGAATRADSINRRLNSLLRYYAMESAFRAGFPSVIGVVSEGAPRLRVLTDLGYEFHIAEKDWNPHFVDHTRLLVVALAREKMTAACTALRARFTSLFDRFPWEGVPLQVDNPAVPQLNRHNQ